MKWWKGWAVRRTIPGLHGIHIAVSYRCTETSYWVWNRPTRKISIRLKQSSKKSRKRKVLSWIMSWMWKIWRFWSLNLKRLSRLRRVKISQLPLMNSFGAPSVLCLTAGWTNVPSSIVRWKGFLPNGARLSAYRLWCSAIWAILPLPVYVSLVMPVTEKISSMVNTWSTHKAKTWWLVSVHRNRSRRLVRSVGRNVPVFQKKTASPNILQWKKPCRKSIGNWTNCKQSWKTIIMICRIWNSPYRKENCGSCKPVTESVPVLQWLKLQSICCIRVWLTRRRHWNVSNRINWTSCFTRYSTRWPKNRRKFGWKDCRHLRERQRDRSCSSPMMQQNGMLTERRS